jgi:DNA-binding MarR family transcriptional regulator
MTITQLKAARRHSLSTTALLALLVLHQKSHLSMTELAAAIDTSTANITQVADFLVNSGLAVQERARGDRRKVIIGITDKGCELAVELKEPEPEFEPI